MDQLVNGINFHLLMHWFWSCFYNSSLVLHNWSCYLKLPSLFAAWLFWTFHNKSDTMNRLSETVLALLGHSDWWIGGLYRPEQGFASFGLWTDEFQKACIKAFDQFK